MPVSLELDDVAFLIDIVRTDPPTTADAAADVLRALPLDHEARAAAVAAVAASGRAAQGWPAAVARAEDPPGGDPDDAMLAAALAARQQLFATNSVPAEVRERLSGLPARWSAGLLTELVEELLFAALRGRPRTVLKAGTLRLKEIAWALSRSGGRPVRAYLPDPRVSADPSPRGWAEQVLGLVHPRHFVGLVRARVEDPDRSARERTDALRRLADVSPRWWRDVVVDLRPPDGTHSDLVPLLFMLGQTRIDEIDVYAEDGPPPEPRPVTPTRTVHPRLDAPERVGPRAEFLIGIGLALHGTAGVTGTVEVPDGRFRLTMELVAPGFDLERPVWEVEVTPEERYPCLQVSVRAPEEPDEYLLRVLYAIDGRPIGTAARLVVVGRETPPGAAATEVAPGLVHDPDPDTEPDITMYVLRDDRRRVLRWSCYSPHQPEAERCAGSLLDRADVDIEQFVVGLDKRASFEDQRRSGYLRSVAEDIAAVVPVDVWRMLRRVGAVTKAPPSVLIISDYLDLPWELAAVHRPWWPSTEATLGAQARLGCWPLPSARFAHQETATPPPHLRLSSMAVAHTEIATLPRAREEAEYLRSGYDAQRVPLDSESILACLAGGAEGADIFHLAAHGDFDGLDVEEGVALDEREVRAVGTGGVRLAFLNACRQGRGHTRLGRPAGIPSAFVAIGAGAVVAPMWKINDYVAGDVAEDFYRAVLKNGECPAEHVRALRASVAKGKAFDRAAYVYIGHPNLRVVWDGPTPLY